MRVTVFFPFVPFLIILPNAIAMTLTSVPPGAQVWVSPADSPCFFLKGRTPCILRLPVCSTSRPSKIENLLKFVYPGRFPRFVRVPILPPGRLHVELPEVSLSELPRRSSSSAQAESFAEMPKLKSVDSDTERNEKFRNMDENGRVLHDLITPTSDARVIARESLDDPTAVEIWWLPLKPRKPVRVYRTVAPAGIAPFQPNIAISPDGQWVAYSKGNAKEEDIALWCPCTGETRLLTRTRDRSECMPAWSPDGRWIAYIADSTMNLKDEELGPGSPPPPGAVFDQPPRGGPGSIYITELRIMDWRGCHDRLVAKGIGSEVAFSPDARSLAYDGGEGIKVVEVATGERRTVAEGIHAEGGDEEIQWSPDGRWLAVVAGIPVTDAVDDPDRAPWLVLVNIAERQARTVTAIGEVESDIVWMPDSSALGLNVEQTQADGSTAIPFVVFRTDGSRAAKLGLPTFKALRVEWLPSRTIALSRPRCRCRIPACRRRHTSSIPPRGPADWRS